jgi:D-alanyl-D-alanine carboxypeptidase
MKKTVATQQPVVPQQPVEDGLGIFASQLPCGRAWGHSGGILDYGTQVAASEDGERVVVISARGFGFVEPPNAGRLLCSKRAS